MALTHSFLLTGTTGFIASLVRYKWPKLKTSGLWHVAIALPGRPPNEQSPRQRIREFVYPALRPEYPGSFDTAPSSGCRSGMIGDAFLEIAIRDFRNPYRNTPSRSFQSKKLQTLFDRSPKPNVANCFAKYFDHALERQFSDPLAKAAANNTGNHRNKSFSDKIITH